MSLKRGWLVGLAALSLTASQPASAGLTERLGRQLGRGVGQGAVEKIQPALTQTLADVDGRLTVHETRIGNIAQELIGKTSTQVGVRLDQVDGILEQRILQTQLGVTQVLDHGLDRVDGISRARIAQLNESAANRISQADKAVQDALQSADAILKNRISDVDTTVARSLDRADGLLEARIDQIDEVAGRRLGNVDIIATKQRLGLERSIVRAVWLCSLVIFVVALVWSIWHTYLKREGEITKAPSGPQRAKEYIKALGMPLVRHLAVGAVVAILLALLPSWLPMAAETDQARLVEQHELELERSLAQLDFTHVRYHASQLEFLKPEASTRYKAAVAKAELLRDLIERPTALATTAGMTSMIERLRAAERLSGRPDPDLRTVRALILWRRERSRPAENEAASLAARALWSKQNFTLAPLARLIIRSYLLAPAPDPETQRRLAALNQPLPEPDAAKELSRRLDSGAELETVEGLNAVLGTPGPEPLGSVFEDVATLFQMVAELEKVASSEYVQMIKAQADLAASRATDTTDSKARERRNAHANQVVRAFERFDQQLLDTPVLKANALVLTAFRCNDALLTHALWFTTQSSTDAWPKKLTELTGKDDWKLKLALAPARTVWARRYQALLEGPARELVELQEAARFDDFEAKTLRFEEAYALTRGVVIHPQQGKGKANGKTPEPPSLVLLRAASAAAALNLYVESPGGRVPFALDLIDEMLESPTSVSEARTAAQSEFYETLEQLQVGLLTPGVSVI